ncbi:hypothetical protein TH66_19195 [Carbonactinospora thermoautotrophica]|uniref:DUF3800 domain-containing protein n=1 Tax=Carbonactinospora thermoautotrophica TaxID=1469144 RepID=A0A132NF39_9ACTN|nr:hypothetical protein [Carbonactinospora thermoautotrophica]KWW97666.1 hypothetical protein TH66_19195 [Carbonactinospora thermoautotrophica]KWX00885.1 hypothetical protein LI90_1913 [Carbonactinospora thermoautotrophica]KWX08669.1 hypothetical protein TR74_13950 [Carbonactinospora thermoautotrophica]
MFAYVDESESDQRRDPGVYLLGAALVPAPVMEQARDVLRGLLLPGQRKLHWHNESDKRRRLITETDFNGEKWFWF